MRIRPAEAGDGPAIASVLNALLATTTFEWTDRPLAPTSMRDWMDEHDTVLVADDGGDIVGVAAFGPFRDVVKRPGYRFTVENTVHVREDRWGSGVGQALMRAIIGEAQERAKHTMVAVIDGSNTRSIEFHHRLGFVEVGRMPEVGAKFGRWLDLVLLQLRLDERAGPGDD